MVDLSDVCYTGCFNLQSNFSVSSAFVIGSMIVYFRRGNLLVVTRNSVKMRRETNDATG